jgi:Spy/CpxP family protein refolding chaperone
MPDLTEDQRAQIVAIHQKADADRLAISRKEHEDILAVLSDDQKKEVDDIIAKEKEEAAAKHKAKLEATTRPAA